MQASDDMQLLQEYARGRSEEAFTALVSRHINLVYAAAPRSVNNPSHAEEITQSVFVTLARKAGGLPRGTVLSGWLYQTARLSACKFVRTETRRLHREQQAHIQSTMNDPEPEPWMRVGPLLDEAMAQLNEKDRDAIVLRFFEGKQLKEVGEALGTTEDAAQMRVGRALDKLRDFFQCRGITVPAGALALAISENSISAAPAGLSATVAAGAIQGSALTVSTLTSVQAAIHIMTTAKIGVAVGLCAAATIIGLQYQQISTQKQTFQQLVAQVAQAAPQAQTNRALLADLAKLREQNDAYAKEIAGMQRDVAKARAHASSALTEKAAALAAAAGKKGSVLGDILKDPDMLDFMRNQIATSVKSQYAPLVKKLNLSQEQADKFYQILIDGSLSGVNALQSGNLSAADPKASEAEIQSLLGADGFAQYSAFKETAGDQAMLALMTKDFADNPLTAGQQQQLLQAMTTARQNASAITAPVTDKAAMLDPSPAQQEQVNQNILRQAAAFLSPEQLQSLASSQSNMMTMQKLGTAMAQKMFNSPPAAQS
jgi:RNA polymerase sigma factor (sigma-70 family)